MATYNPGRPPSERDLVLLLNGSPQPRGVLTSTGAAVNNITTAVPFNRGIDAAGTFTVLADALAGRVLLVSATAAGFLLPSVQATVGNPNLNYTVCTSSSVAALAAGTFVGVPIAAGEVKSLIMLPTEGWLQFISSSGTASLIVWEML